MFDPRDSTRRAAGVLLHPTSLPGPWGCGDFGPAVEPFLDWAASAGFGIWQILPITPPAGGDSPYTSLSAFAINPLLISIDRLIEDGLLDADTCEPYKAVAGEACDMEAAAKAKAALLPLAYERFQEEPGDLEEEMKACREDPLQAPWLESWCLFAALRSALGTGGWWTWEEGLARRRPETLAEAATSHREAAAYQRFLQCVALRHWRAVKEAAHARGLRIFGDLPIYVAYDSADVWTRPELFRLDDALRPTHVAGVPPDYFSEEGQLWGNPLYRWRAMEEAGFGWWIDRLKSNLHIADVVRIDHFRAFADYWEVEAAATDARGGAWRLGPGKVFFDVLKEELGEPLPLVAEDLGDLSDSVHTLRHDAGLAGMKVLQFGFDPIDVDHAPHRLTEDTVYYSGTHDNDTSLGWFWAQSDEVRGRLRAYAGGQDATIGRDLMRMVLTSVARWAMFPMQDLLYKGSEARMNTPGVADGNWLWRLTDLPDDGTTGWLRHMAELTGRLSPSVLDETGAEETESDEVGSESTGSEPTDGAA